MTVQALEVLNSKKFLAAAIATLVGYLGMRDGMSTEQIAFIVAPMIAYVGAQGIADMGKSRTSIEAANRNVPKP